MSSLKTLAQRAKLRLRNISYDLSGEEDCNKAYSEACLAARMQYAIISNQSRITSDPLYNKVKKMLLKDEDIINPLSTLIEHSIYDQMNQIQKEKYIVKLSKRYAEMKAYALKEISEEMQNKIS